MCSYLSKSNGHINFMTMTRQILEDEMLFAVEKEVATESGDLSFFYPIRIQVEAIQ